MKLLPFMSCCKQRKTVAAQPYSIKSVYNPEHAVVDIVFVHGLTGDRERTWSSQSGSLWPETLLPSKVPNARILTFGYDANIVKLIGVVSGNAIGDHAGTFLTALATARNTDEESMNRPIFFVVHSLGGLVCQDALRTAFLSPYPHHRKIIDCTRGIAFFGTPLAGAGLAPAAELLAKFLRKVGKNANAEILGVLRQDSEVLGRIQADFHRMLKSRVKDGHPEINIVCFYEQLPLQLIGQRVVPKQSATIPGYEDIGIHANHMDMVHFSAETDDGFVQLVGVLKRWIDELQHPPAAAAGHERVAATQAAAHPIQPTPTAQAAAQSSDAERQRRGAGGSGVSVGGNVTGSNIVSGDQTVHGGLSFGSGS